MLSGYITTLKIKQKLDVSSEGPSSRVSLFHCLHCLLCLSVALNDLFLKNGDFALCNIP